MCGFAPRIKKLPERGGGSADAHIAEESRGPWDVFVSYASDDRDVANAVLAYLERHAIKCWIAPRDVTPGALYADEIIRSINTSKVLLLVLSENAAASPHVGKEIERASSKRRSIIALRTDAAPLTTALEYFLSESQWVDLRADGREVAFARLLSAIRHKLSPDATTQGADRGFATPSVGSQPKRRLSRPVLLLGALIALAAVYLAADRFWWSKHAAGASHMAAGAPAPAPAATGIPEKSLAVLPFLNMSGDSKDSYLGDGISGEILSALSKLPGLKVIGRASSFQFRDHDVDAVKVGRVLNVRSLLTGTVQRAADKLRISVELIDATSGVQLWSQHFDRSFGNLFALEDDISSAVTTALAVQLGMPAGQPLVQTATGNPHAHDLYLRARELSYRSDEPSLNQAVALFDQAIAEDPNYAAAWAGLTYTYLFLADAYRAPIELLPVMKGAAEKTVALDPKLAEGHAYLSYILMGYQRDFPAGERELEKAVGLNPGSADVQFFLGIDRILTRDAASSQSAFQTAEKIDPLNPFIPFVQIWAATALGDSETALRKAERTLELDPAFSYFTDPLVYAYGSFGRWQDCVARSAAAPAGAGTQREPDYKAAVCYAHLGDTEHARRILSQLETAAQKRYVDHVNIAEIHAALGEKDAAFRALEQAYHDRSQPLLVVWFVPEFRSLADDPRYRALMEKTYAGLRPGTTP